MALAGELAELLEHDRLRRHVDSKRQRLGGEHQLHQAGGKQLLHGLLVRRDHAGVMSGDAGLECFEPAGKAKHSEILFCKMGGVLDSGSPDLHTIGLGCKAKAGPCHHLGGGVTTRPGEDEVDGGEEATTEEMLGHLDAAWRREPGASSSSLPEHVDHSLVPPQPIGLEHRQSFQGMVVEAIAEQVGRFERYRAVILDDQAGRPTPALYPAGEFGWVGDGRGEADQLNGLRQVDDDFLPHRATVPVLEIVHLVENDDTEIVQRSRPGVDHVAKHFCGHHHDWRLGVDGVVSGEQAHPLASIGSDQVTELLVG